jgi:hypothetical protein
MCVRLPATACLMVGFLLPCACVKPSCRNIVVRADASGTQANRLTMRLISESLEFTESYDFLVREGHVEEAICVSGQRWTVAVRALDRYGHITHTGGMMAVPDSALRLEVQMHATANAPSFVVALSPCDDRPALRLQSHSGATSPPRTNSAPYATCSDAAASHPTHSGRYGLPATP